MDIDDMDMACIWILLGRAEMRGVGGGERSQEDENEQRRKMREWEF